MMGLSAPLIPAECSMSGNDWFPFYFDRLRKSKWWRRASDVARARNVMMWGEAFKAVPAGSLPDDDDELAEAAGYGMDIDAFLLVKAEVMAPWVLCTDGRWYHPTVCEVVLDSWAKAGDRRRKDAERKARQRAQVRGVTPQTSDVTGDNTEVTRDIVDVTPEITTQTEQTREDSEEANASLSTTADEKPEYPDEFEACWKAYPHVRGRSSKSKAFGYWRRVSAARRTLLPAAIARYAREGREPRDECGAPAMDRWLRDQRFLDWLDDSPSGPLPPADVPADVLDIVRFHLRDNAAGYLGYFARQDLPERALVTSSRTMFEKLRPCEGDLGQAGWKLVLEEERAA